MMFSNVTPQDRSRQTENPQYDVSAFLETLKEEEKLLRFILRDNENHVKYVIKLLEPVYFH